MTTPDHWIIRTVDDLCLRVTSGGTPNRSNPEYYEPATIPWVKTGDLTDAFIRDYGERISEDGVRASSAKVLPPNTVLMAMYGATVGMLGMLIEEATCNQAACAMIANPNICDPRWLFYALLNDRDFIVSQATGAAQQNLSGKTIRQFEYSTPPLYEQKAIAEILGALDDKIAANTKLVNTADEWVRAEYDRMANSSDEKRTIADLVTHRRNAADPALFEVHVPYVGLEHIPRRSMWLATHGTSDEVSSNKSHFQPGDILFGKLRPYFHKVVTAPKAGICSTDILVLTSINETLSGYALASLSHDSVVQAVTAASEGTRMPRTSWKDLSNVEVPWPGQIAAATLSARVQTVRSFVIGVLSESQTLAATREALLPQLMSGNLQVKEAEQVVATAI
ncbi:hypothetical protein GCM10009715_03360 [Paeniglutamicibacter psychrophenolicus]|uniref:Type I restriction enzyme S subunit n=1 Tax=Paeniglutamicibacter psychrophenolicus TaxID=257454 RepID=A0ABS4WAU8_9MICC|nr:type I restriction enzyme S subunit [Paeniglutamicibacter psychrophenolicus]